jgi:DNA-binding NtrC family response regulator
VTQVSIVNDENIRDDITKFFKAAYQSELMQVLLEIARQVARSDVTILLRGETGTGKKVLARQIHEWSQRSDRPFVTVSCRALAQSRLESLLFGHIRDSFGGAINVKPGQLKTATGGTVFLDEIGDLTPALQIELLRFVEKQHLGEPSGQQTAPENPRIIVASSRDLRHEVCAGHFRPELVYQLETEALILPPLRERREDILPLARRFLTVSTRGNGQPPREFSQEAARALTEYSWPGNVRELRNAIERAAVLSQGTLIEKEHLPDAIFDRHPEAGDSQPLLSPFDAASLILQDADERTSSGILPFKERK